MRAVNERIISKISIYDLFNASSTPTSDVTNNYDYYLSRQFKSLENQEVKTVIIGNSYGLYGFPNAQLEHSVNISMHSLSIKQIQQLTEHILTHYPHIDNFVFCLGFFDLYFDLFASNDSFNRNIINAISQLTCHHDIKYVSDSETDGPLVFSRLAMQVAPLCEIAGMNDQDSLNTIYDSTQRLLNSTDSIDVRQQNIIAKQRAVLHSNSVKHQRTFDENQLRIGKITLALDLSGKKHFWLTPPFPAAYVNNLDTKMVLSHRQFFAKYNTENSIFIDLSEADDYQQQDFRDGDHLNLIGASKLVARLRKLNIPL